MAKTKTSRNIPDYVVTAARAKTVARDLIRVPVRVECSDANIYFIAADVSDYLATLSPEDIASAEGNEWELCDVVDRCLPWLADRGHKKAKRLMVFLNNNGADNLDYSVAFSRVDAARWLKAQPSAKRVRRETRAQIVKRMKQAWATRRRNAGFVGIDKAPEMAWSSEPDRMVMIREQPSSNLTPAQRAKAAWATRRAKMTAAREIKEAKAAAAKAEKLQALRAKFAGVLRIKRAPMIKHEDWEV